jgi:hypothetical protein
LTLSSENERLSGPGFSVRSDNTKPQLPQKISPVSTSVISAFFPHLKQLCLMLGIRLTMPPKSVRGLKLGDL